MKHIYLILSPFVFLWLLTGCLEDPDMDTSLQNAKAPEVLLIDSLTTHTATTLHLEFEVIRENGSPVTECGVCWSNEEGTSANINFKDRRYAKADKAGKGQFAITIPDLQHNTSYFVCAYAINAVDTAYSTVSPFSTVPGIGAVEKVESDSVKATSVFLKAKILSSKCGEGTILERGFYLSDKSSDLTEANADTIIQCPLGSIVNPMEDDSFSCVVSKLKPETMYYVKAFAKNSFGVFPSVVDSFVTTTGKPAIAAIEVDSIGFTNAALSAFVTDEGDAEVTERGFCWSTTELPVVDGGKDTLVCGKGKGRFNGMICNLEAKKKYYARAYATNVFGTTYSDSTVVISTKSELPVVVTNTVSPEMLINGTAEISGEVLNEGMSPVITLGICWSSRYPIPTVTNSEKMEVSPDELDDKNKIAKTLSNLKGGTKYYVCVYAINSKGLPGYGNVQSFTTPAIFTTRSIYAGANRAFSAAFSLKGQAYVVGGDIGNDCSNELLGYIVERNEWVQLTPYTKAYTQMTACAKGDVAYVMGGTDKKQIKSECMAYHPFNNMWTDIKPLPGNAPRYEAVSFVYRDSLYLLGGVDAVGYSKEIWKYDINGGNWKLQTTKFPVAQKKGVALVAGDNVYAGLGESAGLSKGFWVSSDSLTVWKPAEGSLPSNIGTIVSGVYYKNDQWDSFFMIDDKAVIWEYCLADGSWRQRSTLTDNRMTNYHIFILNDKIYILGQDLFKTNWFKTYDPIWDN